MWPGEHRPTVRYMSTHRNAIVTGGSRGIGRALTGVLVAGGFHVIIDARGAQELHTAVAELGDAVTAVPGDISDPGHRAELVARARSHGDLDLLVNNAGILGASPLPALADYPIDDLRAALEINVLAPIALTQLALPDLRAHNGAVLTITSDAAREPYAGWGGYGAAKAALEQACNILAAEEANLRVWWVDPGDVRTAMHQLAYAGEDISDRPLPAEVAPGFARLLAERPPSGRYLVSDWVPAGGGTR